MVCSYKKDVVNNSYGQRYLLTVKHCWDIFYLKKSSTLAHKIVLINIYSPSLLTHWLHNYTLTVEYAHGRCTIESRQSKGWACVLNMYYSHDNYICPTTKSQSVHDSFYELSEQLPKCSPVCIVECIEPKAGSAGWAMAYPNFIGQCFICCAYNTLIVRC